MMSGTWSCLCSHGATAELGCSCCYTKPSQTGFIPAKPRETVTLTWSILSLSENSINSAAAHSKGSDRIWVRRSRVWPAPATRCHQLLDQRRSEPKMRLYQPIYHSRARLSHVPHIYPEKTGTFPSKTAQCFCLLPLRSLVNSPVLQSLQQLHCCHRTEKENSTHLWCLSPVLMKDVGALGCHVLSLNKTQACPTP